MYVVGWLVRLLLVRQQWGKGRQSWSAFITAAAFGGTAAPVTLGTPCVLSDAFEC